MRDHAKALQHAPPPAPAVPVPVPAFPSMSTGVRPPPPSGPAPFPLAPMPVLQQQGGYQPYGAAVDGAPPPPPAAPYGYPMGAGGGGVGDGGYHPYAPYGAAIQAPQADSYGAQVQHSAATGGYQNRSYHGHGQGQGGYQQHQHSQLPEHERCTLKVWGIPSYVTEEDLRRHFELFGHVVELQLTPMAPRGGGSAAAAEGGAETDKKNVYFECLVQYYSAANAKKRLGAQDSVLNNRFIKFRASPFNIVPPADVPPPSADILHRDEQIVLGNISTTAAAVGPAQSRKKPAPTGFNMYAAGASNKYRRGADDDNNRVPSGVPADSDTGAGEGGVGSSSSPAGGAVGASAVPAPVAAPALTQEKYEMKQKFEQLKTLRQQAEEIAKKKEEILLVRYVTAFRCVCYISLLSLIATSYH